jgi:hypothetical protein
MAWLDAIRRLWALVQCRPFNKPCIAPATFNCHKSIAWKSMKPLRHNSWRAPRNHVQLQFAQNDNTSKIHVGAACIMEEDKGLRRLKILWTRWNAYNPNFWRNYQKWKLMRQNKHSNKSRRKSDMIINFAAVSHVCCFYTLYRFPKFAIGA